MTEDIKADAENVMKRCQIGTKNYNEANNLHAECYGTIGRLLLQVETLSRCLFQMQEAARDLEAKASSALKCTVCSCHFNLDSEGGLEGSFGSLPVAFCPTCYASVCDMVDQMRIKDLESQEPVACPYCHNSATLGAVYFDQNCIGCVKRMSHPPQRTEQEIKDGSYCQACDGALCTAKKGCVALSNPPQRPRVVFPTMLRKMWSGGEVQDWLDENVNKEKNT